MIASPIYPTAGLEELVRSIGLGWRLDLFGPPELSIAHLHQRLIEGDEAARAKFVDGSVRLTLESVAALADQSVEKARAFAEQLFGQGSAQMLVMVWRVLQGIDVGTVHLDLDQASRFHMEIMLRSDRKGTEEKYESHEVFDLHVIRQFGISKLNGQLPLLVGFYPMWRPPQV